MVIYNKFDAALEEFKKSVIKAAKGKWNRKFNKNHHRIYTVAGAYVRYNMSMDHNRWYEDRNKYYEEYSQIMQDRYSALYPNNSKQSIFAVLRVN